MKHQKGEISPVTIVLGIVLLAAIGGALFPRMNWGKVTWSPSEMVTVTGEAKSQEKNQIASFTAGVDAVNDKKEDAVKEVNDKVTAIIVALKNFGITDENIKTQNLSIYQNEEMYTTGGVQKSRKGQWRVSNSVEITLRNIDDASKLTDLLTSTGATNVWGPNFRFDDTSAIEKTLYDQAMKDARERAEIIAKASGRTLGKVMSVNEGGSSVGTYPMYDKAQGMGGGAPVEAGTGTVSKTLTVSFELK